MLSAAATVSPTLELMYTLCLFVDITIFISDVVVAHHSQEPPAPKQPRLLSPPPLPSSPLPKAARPQTLDLVLPDIFPKSATSGEIGDTTSDDKKQQQATLKPPKPPFGDGDQVSL